MQILSRRTLQIKFAERANKQIVRETRDSIAKLRARPDPVVVNGFPDEPILHQIVRDEFGTFWKRNQTNTDWELFITEESEEFTIPIVASLPPIPATRAQLVWYTGQMWGSAPGQVRWFPMMRYTSLTGLP